MMNRSYDGRAPTSSGGMTPGNWSPDSGLLPCQG